MLGCIQTMQPMILSTQKEINEGLQNVQLYNHDMAPGLTFNGNRHPEHRFGIHSYLVAQILVGFYISLELSILLLVLEEKKQAVKSFFRFFGILGQWEDNRRKLIKTIIF